MWLRGSRGGCGGGGVLAGVLVYIDIQISCKTSLIHQYLIIL